MTSSASEEAQPEFVHLRVRSEFSIVEGLIKMRDLAKRAAELKMPAIAIADRGNLYGLVKFHQACLAAQVKPLTACELRVRPEAHQEYQLPDGELLFLVRNETGYQNLLALVSAAHTQPLKDGNDQEVRAIPEALLHHHHEGLLVLSGGIRGSIAQAILAGKTPAAQGFLERCQKLWGDAFYVELQRIGRSGEAELENAILELANSADAPVVATHDVCFLSAEDYFAHEARVCIQTSQKLDDPARKSDFLESQYLQDRQQMRELFADCEACSDNTVEIAKRCNFSLRTGEVHLPNFPAKGGSSDKDQLKQYAEEGLERLEKEGLLSLDTITVESYRERLDFELKTINTMGFAGYFLVVMEFVRWAKDNAIPVGPGRGSGAGSLVAYALAITDLDPLAYDLLFERFLNPERHSMPDFDIDFCIEGRDRVIAHVSELYGDKLSQIITFGTMAAKAVVRDVTRVQNKPYGLGDALAKLIPFAPDMTLKRAMKEEKALRDLVKNSEEAAEVIDMAFKLEGIARNVGKHPGGVVIAPGSLVEHVALTLDENGAVVSQFDKDDVEQVGLVKFDFLGLRTLTLINQTVQRVNKAMKEDETPIDIRKIPLDDVKIFTALQKGDTDSVFQLESRGMRELIKRLGPDRFEDIVSLVALYRPGPLDSGMTNDFVIRRHKPSAIKYEHPDLKEVLENTYGVIVYQEQVMQIAQILAGYSLGDADILRRAMSKKKPSEMELQRDKFISGAAERGIAAKDSNRIFNTMEKFAGYGFNRSHSVGYGLIAYQTAWLKCHYPAEFMAVTMSLEMDHSDKLASSVTTCKRMGLRVLPPDLNSSNYHFEVVEPNTIRYGLGAIKGLGKGVVDSIVSNREEDGAYLDLSYFAQRQVQSVSKRVAEALVKSGAMDVLAQDTNQNSHEAAGYANREALMCDLQAAFDEAERMKNDAKANLVDMFDASGTTPKAASLPATPSEPWSPKQTLDFEYEALGLFLSGHPATAFAAEFAPKGAKEIGNLSLTDKVETVVALILEVRKLTTKNGKKIAFVVLEDESGRMEASVPAAMLEKSAHLLEKNQVVVASGNIEADQHTDGIKMYLKKINSPVMERSKVTSSIEITLESASYQTEEQRTELLDKLEEVLKEFKGEGCVVQICYQGQAALVDLVLTAWSVIPSDDCLRALTELSGEGAVRYVDKS